MMMGFGMFGWLFGLLFMFIFLALGAVVVIWLVREIAPGLSGSTPRGADPNTSATGRACPTCGRPMQVGWTVCPYDGTPLEG